MKKKVLIFAIGLSFLAPGISWGHMDVCQAGGPGSTGCKVSKTFELEAGPAGGSTTITYETTCGEGYYACCILNIMTGEGSATCVEK
ncbi:hypothetical protein PBT90_01830 [Algoriphagus halophytocola]|uniref:hypothetical protein n=1 Tax=Algoriphagus halophytocola TaxID=2991499 RepID=UPI0022DDFCC8|nr:hypothetical protein [Algoriphagus sp. TR-M9]WBL43445.1 hypothetical protein PBT90_01830 [Algoriphagus sp. TR-M9]